MENEVSKDEMTRRDTSSVATRTAIANKPKPQMAKEIKSSKARPQNASSTEDVNRPRDFEREEDGPAIFFDMLLDSGAELPLLLHEDFDLLGFTKQDMNAASVLELNTAAGMVSTALCFELLVGLELGNSRAEYWQDYAEYSQARFFPTRVVKLAPNIKAPAYGAFSGDRLSGMLPFLAYYLASAPGNSQIWLGEKRAEVLRAENMPAGLRYGPPGGPFSDSRVAGRDRRTKIGTLGGSMAGVEESDF